jgi:hypothetical protein
MPDRTPAQARERFVAPLRRSLSCITNAQIIVSTIGKPGQPEALTLSEDPLRLRTLHGVEYQLRLRQQFHLVPEGRAWRVTTDAYQYRLDNVGGQELASWHWHPGTGNPHPHLHVPGGPAGGSTHLPTGRVSIESVIRVLLTDLGVQPARDHVSDFHDVLNASEGPFIESRRWHAWRRPQANGPK